MTSTSTTITTGNDFEFTQQDFENLRSIITGETGIQLPDHKKNLMYSRLARRLRALGLESFKEYTAYVEAELAARKDTELGNMINAMTTNVTALFREEHHFKHLAENLEQLLEKFGKVRIWSSACSTGEEPWSIAMTVGDFLKKNPTADIKITATDLDTNAITKAQAAKFMIDPDVRNAHPLMKKFLKPTGEANKNTFSKEEEFEIVPELRSLITFKQMNLLKPWPLVLENTYHVIFCRNVVIYFDKETQRGLFANFEKRQPEGTLLYIGHSESLINVTDSYKLLGRTSYEKLPANEG